MSFDAGKREFKPFLCLSLSSSIHPSICIVMCHIGKANSVKLYWHATDMLGVIGQGWCVVFHCGQNWRVSLQPIKWWAWSDLIHLSSEIAAVWGVQQKQMGEECMIKHAQAFVNRMHHQILLALCTAASELEEHNYNQLFYNQRILLVILSPS